MGVTPVRRAWYGDHRGECHGAEGLEVVSTKYAIYIININAFPGRRYCIRENMRQSGYAGRDHPESREAVC